MEIPSEAGYETGQRRIGERIEVVHDGGVSAYRLFLDTCGVVIADGQRWVHSGDTIKLGVGREYQVVDLDTTNAPVLAGYTGKMGIAVKPVSNEPGIVFVIPQGQLDRICISVNPTQTL